MEVYSDYPARVGQTLYALKINSNYSVILFLHIKYGEIGY
jgi:hypothetical protein